jgi:4-hydroxy-2-oxoheptanedioate aldolase
MRDIKLKSLMKSRGVVVNGWLAIPSAYSAEVMAHSGFDSLTIDMQHGLADYATAVTMMQAISTTDTTPLARATWNEPGLIMRLLDAGCMGIICPMIETRAQCEALVSACRYPPVGGRSYGPNRVTLYTGGDYLANSNTTVTVFAMIETALAMKNLDDILDTPTLDAVYVGPADLQLSTWNRFAGDDKKSELLEMLKRIADSCAKRGQMAGIHCSDAAHANQMIELGYRFVTLASDARMMTLGAAEMVNGVRKGAGEQKLKY